MADRLLEKIRQALADPAGIDTTPFDDLTPNRLEEVASLNALGDLYGRAGDTARAYGFYRRAVELYQADGYNTKAIAVLRKAARLPAVPSSAFWELGELYAAEGFRAEASQQYLRYADAERERGKSDSVLRAYERIVELEPGNGRIRLALAEIYYQSGLRDRAAEQFRSARELLEPAEETDEARRIADRLADLADDATGFEDDALPEELELPVDEGSEAVIDGPAIDLEAEMRGEKVPVAESPVSEESEESEDVLDLADEAEPHHQRPRSLRNGPDTEELDILRGALDELEQAEGGTAEESVDVIENDFIRSVDEEPAKVSAKADDLEVIEEPTAAEPELSIIDGESGESARVEGPGLDEVVDDFKDAMSTLTEGDDPQGHYDLGIAYKEMGMLDDAVVEFQAAARHKRLRDKAACLLAECFIDMGRPELAVKELRRALAAAGSEDERLGLHYRLARTLLARDRRSEALDEFLECYAIDVGYRDVAEQIKRLRG
ncbi:MAG: tetratricopeptide repeat protein [Candidatus Coatesbacteria bacterium]|nr:tetratricopeptide repeat protein [Candidatus Coatesbacteria bacterium]